MAFGGLSMSNLLIVLSFWILTIVSSASMAQPAGDRVQDLIGIWRVPGEPTDITIYDDHTVLHSRLGRGDILHVNAQYFNINYRERNFSCHYLARNDSATELSLIRVEHLDPAECDLGLLRRAPWREGVQGPVSQIWQQIKDSEEIGLLELFRRQFGARTPEYDARAVERIAALKRALTVSDAANQWAIIQNTTSQAVLTGFIVRYGETDYGRYARLRLEELKEQEQSVREAEEEKRRKAAALSTPSTARPVTVTLLEKIAEEGTWAVGGASNCGISKKTYTLELVGSQAKWADGLNNVYVEQIEFSNETEARTVTRTGSRRGTVWHYIKLRADEINVQPSDKSPFTLARCGS